MKKTAVIDFTEELWIEKGHADGTKEKPVRVSFESHQIPKEPDPNEFKDLLIIGGLSALGALTASAFGWPVAPVFGVITTAGVTYMASDFASGGVTPTISGFKFHDSGTGSTAAAIGNTALQTPTGIARVTGTPTNPTAVQYQTQATITYNATFAITEWGLFSASTSGTLWSRRVFAAQDVVDTDTLTFKYILTIVAG